MKVRSLLRVCLALVITAPRPECDSPSMEMGQRVIPFRGTAVPRARGVRCWFLRGPFLRSAVPAVIITVN